MTLSSSDSGQSWTGEVCWRMAFACLTNNFHSVGYLMFIEIDRNQARDSLELELTELKVEVSLSQ